MSAADIIGAVIDALPEAVELIRDLADAGADPKREIRRIRNTHPLLAEIEREFDDAIDAKFGPQSERRRVSRDEEEA